MKSLPTRNALAAQSKPTVNVAIAYADSLTRRIAERVCYRIIRRIHHVFDVRTFFWSFEALGQSDTLEQAAGIAATADVIVYSVHAMAELPAITRTWADRWLARTGQPNGALVALLKTAGPVNDAPLAAEIQLRALARKARMELFVNVIDCPARETSPMIRSSLIADEQCGAVAGPTCAIA